MAHLTKENKRFIRDNYQSMTDDQMAEKLGCTAQTVARNRKKEGLTKSGAKGGKPKPDDLEKSGSVSTRLSIDAQSNEKKQADFFKKQLVNSLYYDYIKEQFSEREIEYYLEEWSALCVQFQDIVATESRQIDELIKTSIMDNRLLKNIKIIEDEIGRTQEEIKQLREDRDLNSDTDAQELNDKLMELVNYMSSVSKQMSKDHQEFVNTKNKLLNELNARRKDRVEQIRKAGNTFLSMVQAFQDEEIKEQQGKHAELVRQAKERKKDIWRQKNTFPDGTSDNILLDENTNFEDESEE